MIRFFAGKGGAGKTTCAAAEAVRLSRSARTLVVSTDPAHSLGDALSVRLRASPTPVRRNLFAAELDADAALRRWLSRRLPAFRAIASRGTYFDDEDLDALLGLSLPGVDELVGLVELERLSRGFDEVVVDAAPTGHTLRLLAMPETLARLADVLGDLQAKHHALAIALRGSAPRDREDRAIDELRGQADSLRAALRDPARTALTWLMLPEELSLLEAQDGLRALRELPVVRVLVNRVTRAPDRPCALCDGRRAREAQVLRAARRLGPPVEVIYEAQTEPRGASALGRLRPAPAELPRAHRSPARQSPARGASLASQVVPPGTRLALFGGKGGVGKTTAAAASALALAEAGRRVLLLSADPAHSLSDALGVELSDSPREIAPGLIARELDASAVHAAARARTRASVDAFFDSLRGGSRFDAAYDRAALHGLFELTPPGLDELSALFAVLDALAAGDPFDVVVVDTAPTGHTLRLLALPAQAREWVKALLQLLLKYRAVAGLGEAAQSLTRLSRDLRAFEELLRDPARCRFVAVTRAAELPVRETAWLARSLSGLRIPAPVVLVNALTEGTCGRCRRAARAEQKWLAALRRSTPGWAMLGARAVSPPPRGLAKLRAFDHAWTGLA